MILLVLWVVTMFLWLLVTVPVGPLAPYAGASSWFAFVAVLLLGLAVFKVVAW